MAYATSTYLAIAAVAAAGAGAYTQDKAAKGAAKDREDAEEVGKAEAAAQRNEQIRQQVREERIRRATIMQGAQNTGVSASSGELGSLGALQTSIGANIGSMARQQASANAVGNLMQSAADKEAAGARGAAIGNFASSVFSAGAGISAQNAAATQPATVANTTPGQNMSPATMPNPYDRNNIFQ